MLEGIKIKKKNKSVPAGLHLQGLQRMNIVIGENGVGKTNLFEAIEKQYEEDDNVLTVFVKASEVKLSEHAKTSADSSEIIKQIADVLKLKDSNTTVDESVTSSIQEIFENVDQNFRSMTGDESITIDPTYSDSVKHEWIVRSALSSLKGKDGDQQIGKLDDFAQGHQRLLIASILKACVDISDANMDGKSVIVLFEEPEIYMHPKLKVKLRDALEEISKTFRVIISTHDPYFIQIREDVKIYSLYKEDNKTKIHPEGAVSGIVDEILHINLYAQLSPNDIAQMEKFDRVYYKQNPTTNGDDGADFKKKNLPLPEYIRHQIHHPENERTLGLVEEVPQEEEVNYYSREELSGSITLMRRAILRRDSGR